MLVLLAVELLGLIPELQLPELVRNKRVMLPQKCHFLLALLPENSLLAYGLLMGLNLVLHVLEAGQPGLVLERPLLCQL